MSNKRTVRRNRETGKFVSAKQAAQPGVSVKTETVELFSIESALNAIHQRFEAKKDDWKKLQVQMRSQNAPFLDPNSLERRVSLARSNEKSVLTRIEALNREPVSGLKDSRMYALLSRLSELLADQGRYEEAIEVSPKIEQREKYTKILEGIRRDDAETCACEDDTFIDPATRERVVSRAMLYRKDIVSLKHKAVVALEICRKCGFVNAR